MPNLLTVLYVNSFKRTGSSFTKYCLNPAKFDTVLIRLQAEPKVTAHYLARPADAMSVKAWTKVFNDGMD